MPTHTHTLLTFVFLASLLPSPVIAQDATDTAALMAAGKPFQQKVMITAYYSPLPDQCCYVKGSFEADKILNGNGTHGADGTPVYSGMLAAPKSYLFGTRVSIPGLGVLEVHDRGGAIVEQEDTHRLDVWVGHGEEGLARALAFGVKRVTATVYPPSAEKPAENFAMTSLAAPMGVLRAFQTTEPTLLSVKPKAGQKGPSVTYLQEQLQKAGYLRVAPTGFFGPTTEEALGAFQKDVGITVATAEVTTETSAYLQATLERQEAKEPLAATIDRSSPAAHIASLQRTMRFLGYYDGRTDGKYSKTLFDAILAFQQEKKLVGDEHSPGAGRIGPKTRGELMTLWRRVHVQKRAEEILAREKVRELLAKRDDVPTQFLGKGEKGNDVKTLQRFLVRKGFLDAKSVTGLFGAATEEALRAYQLHAEVIKSPSDTGAGYFGPATLASVRSDAERLLYSLVRSQGWSAL